MGQRVHDSAAEWWRNEDQLAVPARLRTVTLPPGIPQLTLGFGVIAWVADNLKSPNQATRGQPFTFTREQARFILWFYAVDENGNWLFNRATRRLAKGSGKSPFAAVLALAELLGPVRFLALEPRVPGGVIGQPKWMPVVQIAATSESQTGNTMRMIRAMAHKRTALARRYDLDVGKTYIETPDGGKLQLLTSSASSAEGGETSFAVADETEHWLPNNGGPDLAETIAQNLAKTGGRLLETNNAWIPGIGAVAEDTFEAWIKQEEGRVRGDQRILYDARVAPPQALLYDPDELDEDVPADAVPLTAALEFVYEDTWWVPITPIREQIYSPTYPPSRSRRFYLNQPNATEDAWVLPEQWAALLDQTKTISPEDEVVLFFDGSKSRDATALVGCRMSDGHVFTLGVWQPEPGQNVDTLEVDKAVRDAFKNHKVVAFFGDVREWESFVKVSWPDDLKDDLLIWAVPEGSKEPQPIAWDMRTRSYKFAEAAEMALAEIEQGLFTHDGNAETTAHVLHARRRIDRERMTIRKESKDSPLKIDAAVCVIGARMVRRLVLASPEWEARHNSQKGWVVFA